MSLDLPSISGFSGAGGSAALSQLEKQVARVQQEISKEEQSRDDAATKLQLLMAYEEEIAALEQEISQAQSRQRRAPSPSGRANPGEAEADAPTTSGRLLQTTA